jgi:hypothetical protein
MADGTTRGRSTVTQRVSSRPIKNLAAAPRGYRVFTSQRSIVARYDIRHAGLRRVRRAAAAGTARRWAAAGLLLPGMPSARLPPPRRAGVRGQPGPNAGAGNAGLTEYLASRPPVREARES